MENVTDLRVELLLDRLGLSSQSLAMVREFAELTPGARQALLNAMEVMVDAMKYIRQQADKA